ncbi:sporulation protein YabP [Halobacillus litoralis]|uniref:Sporulation protein YabP n=3 Tax=Halobacillus TaxID=45667 RepID=A0A3E0J225_9BACI|nr:MULTISPECIES: sporulation protein YabP [Halobacillus]MYL51583.1 sporulation protein YabP [Halobacillus litoralis]RDY67247.1 sporulation protein YabP [Halobacillus trueperi]REJ06877.1 sporulation protein YabP [Halobacillus trueperi]SDP67432.1 sporulation protein YabP [Halobacillus aidingensis]
MEGYEKNQGIRSQQPVEHNVKVWNRRNIEISGVKEVDSFDSEEFLLQTSMGYLVVRGQNLQMKNLDLDSGVVSIKGKMYEMTYLDEHQGEKAKGLFSKLFK